ncbi:MAG: hypothetical protein HQL87_12340 [Magnetococcales bacterium]|nr:hypothetical protein [Magnetococcales bacterium]
MSSIKKLEHRVAAKRLVASLEKIIPAGVVTFAAARAGDADFATAYAQTMIPTIRYEFGVDLVPHIPFEAALLTRLANVPLLGHLFEGMKGFDYESVGTLRYFVAVGATAQGDSDELKASRTKALLADALHPNEIAAAHHAGPGGGYMTCVCGPVAP